MEEIVQVEEVNRGDGRVQPAAAADRQRRRPPAAGEIRLGQRNLAHPDSEPGEDAIIVVLPRRLRRHHEPQRRRRHDEGVLVRGQPAGAGGE